MYKWQLDVAAQEAVVARVLETASPSRTYFVLLILATLIASFGLVSDSTATVIGAMIVAPLMGPIIGLALALSRGDTEMFSRSLAAELQGIVLCVAAAAAVAWLVSPSNIEYGNGEITARTYPTLYDMGIGLAAGMAGAYCTINSRLSSSIAGVAIAVALVPPLSVTGLALAGAWQHPHLLHSAVNAFMLFAANLLTIEIACVAVFIAAGVGHLGVMFRQRQLRRGFIATMTLLLVTGYFLSAQLIHLLRERAYRTQVVALLTQALDGIPGASIQALSVKLEAGRLHVVLTAAAPQEVPAPMVADLQQKLSQTVHVGTDLVVGTVISTYYSPQGRLFEPQPAGPTAAELEQQMLENALRLAIASFPHTELVTWQQLPPVTPHARPREVTLTVWSPTVLADPQVAQLQKTVNDELRTSAPDVGPVALTVRTILSQDFNAEGPLERPVIHVPTASELSRMDLEARVRRRLQDLVAQFPEAQLVSVDTAQPPVATVMPPLAGPSMIPSPAASPTPAPAPLTVAAVVRTRTWLKPDTVASWEDDLAKAAGQPVSLSVDDQLGQIVLPGHTPPSRHPHT